MSTIQPTLTDSVSTIQQVVDVHSLHKSGTMFLFKFFKRLSQAQNVTLLSENHAPADDYLVLPVQASELPQKICRCPIRTFEVNQYETAPEIKQHRIFHLRDPRDILASEYFSFGWIHTTDDTPLSDRRREIQAMGIDEYVLSQFETCAWPVDQKYAPLEDYEFNEDTETVVTYEQMVTDFGGWCRKVLTAFGVKHPLIATAKMVWRYRHEFKTSGESMQHKRRITPGDFKEKLQPKTIDQLNQRFETVLKRFGYLK